MPKNRVYKYKDDLSEALHTSISAMHRIGTVSDRTMNRFDASCLAVPPIAPKQIKRLRQRHRVSQPVFARYLNTSESTVEKWESGAKKPSGMALKLLAVVQKHGLNMLT